MAGDKKKLGKEKEKDGKESKRNPKKEAFGLFLSLAMAVVFAVGIKWYIADVYSIPSGSMEPTLFGQEQGGDRVFCFKKSYSLREPEQPYRYETFVFQYPTNNPKHRHYKLNFIKRCVGLPGETVYIRGGNLYVQKSGESAPAIARKSLELQDSIWIPVYQSDFKRNNTDALDYHWSREPAAESWKLSGGVLKGSADKKISLKYKSKIDGYLNNEIGISDRHIKRQVVTFACPVEGCGGELLKTVNSQQLTAFCPKCGAFLSEKDIVPESFKVTGLRSNRNGAQPSRIHPLHSVGDIHVACQLKPLAASGVFSITLNLENDDWELSLNLGPEGGAVLKNNGRAVSGVEMKPLQLSQGIEHKVEFFRFDLQFGLRVDGELVFFHEIERPMLKYDRIDAQSGVTLSLENGEVEISSIAFDRDLYYYYIPETPKRRMEYFTNLRLPGGQEQAYKLAAIMEENHCYIVPSGNYLAFGDNAPNSNDSRRWGPVPEKNLIGPALFVWWPPHRIRILE